MSLLTDFFPKASAGGGVDSRKPNAEIVLVAGGGGSGASPGDMAGGSGGEILRGCVHLLVGCTYPVTIGAGGAAGGTDPSCLGLPTGVGSPGGATSFGKYKAFGGAGAATFTCVSTPPTTSCADACTYFDAAYPTTNNGYGGSGSFGFTPYYHPNVIQRTCAVRFCRTGVVVGNIQTLHGCENWPTFQCFQQYPRLDNASLFGGRKIVSHEAIPPTSPCIPLLPSPSPGALGYTIKMTTCNEFYGMCIGGAPHVVCSIGFQADCGDQLQDFCNMGFLGNCYKFGVQSRYSSRINIPADTGRCLTLFMQCNYPNMGTAGVIRGCAGDSGIAVIVYDCSLGSATAPGALDCTPVTGPQGYRSYVYQGPGTFTIPS